MLGPSLRAKSAATEEKKLNRLRDASLAWLQLLTLNIDGWTCRPLVGFVGALCVWWTDCKRWSWTWVLLVCGVRWRHLVVVDHERGRGTCGRNFVVCCACETHWRDRRRGRIIDLYWSGHQKGKRLLRDHSGCWSTLSWLYVSGLRCHSWVRERTRYLGTSWENAHDSNFQKLLSDEALTL